MTDKKNFYERAGILNQAEFYRELYASRELLHSDYFHALERFHIRWARTMWVYDNVKAGSTLLDIGSGAGVLSILKRNNVTLVGADLSKECAQVTVRNGYDFACAADLKALPFADSSFDYVVSLDVMGHIQFEEKDNVLTEIRRVLKPDGMTLHGIEIMNTTRRKDYDQMNEEELKRFIQIDGHVGMESEANTKARFTRFFSHVQAEPRFSICQSVEELIKQADEYSVPLCDEDLLDYLRNMSHNERRAFNMAMGYVFQQISDLGILLPGSEYLFLKASNAPFDRFYETLADRSALHRQVTDETEKLDKTTAATFDSGWYPAEDFPPIGRWMGRRAKLRFNAKPFAKLALKVVTHIPDVQIKPLHVEFFLNGKAVESLTIAHNEPLTIELSPAAPSTSITDAYELEIRTDRTWQPRPNGPVHRDDREISVAVFDIRLIH